MPYLKHILKPCRAGIIALFLPVIITGLLDAQAPAPAPKPEPDVLILKDGEKLIGQLQNSKGDSVVFKSDIIGEVTVDFKNIQELRTARAFAVIGKDVKLRKHANVSGVPQGTLAATAEKIQVQPAAAPPATVPVSDVGFVVTQPEFEKAVQHREGFFENWAGAITAGLSLVQATQKSRSFTGGVALVRTSPVEAWMNPSNRTLVNFSGSYGKISQPGTPDIKTAIYHFDGEQDRYFTASLFAFGRLAFDHNFSQGLDLQQQYGGGIGWTVLKRPTQELDLTASVSYIHQAFQISSDNKSLVGSTFGETYTHKLKHDALFTEQLSATPTWNDTAAWFATGSATLAVPVTKTFSVSLSALDTFLNQPPVGFKKNSFQFSAGLTYALK